MRSDLLHEQHGKWEPHLYPFVTPFWPAYRPETFRRRLDLPSEKTKRYVTIHMSESGEFLTI